MEPSETTETYSADREVPPVRGPMSRDLSEFAETVNVEIRRQATLRPYATVLLAAASGYVLGAGVPRWAYRAALDAGSKMLVAKVIATLVDDE